METQHKRVKESSLMSPTISTNLKSKNPPVQTPHTFNPNRFSASLKAIPYSIEKKKNEDVGSQVAHLLQDIHEKDTQRKVKDLTNLCKLFKSIPKASFMQIVTTWSSAYMKLLLEHNREVRRATHETMTSLVTGAGGSLVPHLKSLMGPWWFSQFDQVLEISEAARHSFQVAFSTPDKRLEALILCTSEIFLYLEENLKLTPQFKSTPADELHQRVISSSLLALAALLDNLLVSRLDEARATAVSSAEKIFSAHNYFAEFVKSESLVIRSATYSALGSFIRHIPQVINEANMKKISAAILGSFQEKDPTCHSSMWEIILIFSKKYPQCWNIQKTIFDQFWHLLRNGCYGTQQISYPMLVPFINTMPSISSFKGDEFFLDLFQNLWAGRNTCYSSSADSLAFFKAFGECFIWAVKSASKYFDGEDAVHQFRVGLVVRILVGLLWQSFLLVDSSKSLGVLPHISSSGSPEQGQTQIIKLPLHYMQNLGECIIEILSVFSREKEDSLLSTFCTTFKENSLRILQQPGPFEQVNQIFSFLVLLEEHTVNKAERWPLVYLAGPVLSQDFPVIESLDTPDAVRLLSVSVSKFGPRSIVWHLREQVYSGADDYKTKNFMEVFKETFLPWCLDTSSPLVGARLDLLLALLDDEHFPEQWSSIITCANSNGSDPDSIDMLAVLIEKVTREIDKNEGTEYFRPISKLWDHDLLDSTAIKVASSSPPLSNSYSRFLRGVLGTFYFLSTDSVVFILKELILKLKSDLPEEMQFALQIIQSSLSHLEVLLGENELLSCIMVAISECEQKLKLFDKTNAIKGREKRKIDKAEIGIKRFNLRERKTVEGLPKYNLRIREVKEVSSVGIKRKRKKYWCECGKNASCSTSYCICFTEEEPCGKHCCCDGKDRKEYCRNTGESI